jgi:1-acyl-sn-glycerol-3-phosphate acyltransferase
VASALSATYVRAHHRWQLTVHAPVDEPALLVANHGFGTIFDLNVLATLAALDRLKLRHPVTALTHQLAWTLQVGRVLTPFGARPANHDNARDAFARGHNVLVFPGGDIEGFKGWPDRNHIVFSGRRGSARLAVEANVPVVPIVTAGAGESLVSLPGGQRLAKALRLDKLLQLGALPITVSLPWGPNVGAVGFLPYLPLPTKLTTAVLAPMRPVAGHSAEQFGDAVEAAMQASMDAMTAGRTPVLG